jgi:hypothetical protein
MDVTKEKANAKILPAKVPRPDNFSVTKGYTQLGRFN